jgi:transcriptional regulator with XRE-family HTH domain
MDENEKLVYMFCDRLRKLRKRLNMNIEEVAERTGLSFNQIQRIEGDVRMKDGKVIKKGADGRIPTLIILLDFYSKRVSLDSLFNFNVPVTDLSLNKGTEIEIAKEKILSLIKDIKEVAAYLE